MVGLSERQVGRSVDLADWIQVILRGGGKFEFNAVLDHFNVDRSRLESDVDLAVSKLAKGSEGELSDVSELSDDAEAATVVSEDELEPHAEIVSSPAAAMMQRGSRRIAAMVLGNVADKDDRPTR